MASFEFPRRQRVVQEFVGGERAVHDADVVE